MDKANRKAIIAGNWKMNKTATETMGADRRSDPRCEGRLDCEVVVCPPFTTLATAMEKTKGTNIHVGARTCTSRRAARSPARSAPTCWLTWALSM